MTTPIAVAFAKMDALFPILGTSDPIFAPVRPGPGYDDEAGEAVHEYVASCCTASTPTTSTPTCG